MRLFDDEQYWVRTRVGNEAAYKLFERHYTFRQWRHRGEKNGKRFVGPGEYIMLIGKNSKALFVWRKEKYRMDGQKGIECCVFRNENSKEDGFLSSELILEAVMVAQLKWPGERMFTFVNANKIKSSNPGYCFKKAGWRQCGTTKAKKLIILEMVKPPVVVAHYDADLKTTIVE